MAANLQDKHCEKCERITFHVHYHCTRCHNIVFGKHYLKEYLEKYSLTTSQDDLYVVICKMKQEMICLETEINGLKYTIDKQNNHDHL